MRASYIFGAVVLALGCVAGYVIVVVFAPASTTAYLGAVELIALPLLAGFGAYLTSQLQTIREQTNGTIGKLVETVQEHSRMLAAADVPHEAILAPQGPVQAAADGATLPAEPDQPPAKG